MSSPHPRDAVEFTRPGAFNYLDEHVEASLYRNGKVLTKRDEAGTDFGLVGVDRKSCTLDVCDARRLPGALAKTCESNGFEVQHAPLDDTALDFFNHEKVVTHYYPQCEALVAQSTGAQALAFDHNVRSAPGKHSNREIAGGQAVQPPAHIVHGDYTLFSAPQRLRDLATPPGTNDTLRSVLPAGESLISQATVDEVFTQGRRFAIINVWRSIAPEPVQTHPLALCDGQVVLPGDLVTFEIHYADRIGENYFAKYSDRHRFYFYPEMTREEALLLKQWDCAGALAQSNGEKPDSSVAGGPCTFSFHSAFEDLSVPEDAPDRLSIEVRCLVIYPQG